MNAPRMAAIVLAALLLAYPLSIGPVNRYYMGTSAEASRDFPKALKTFYAPLWWCCKVQPFGVLMQRYEEMWLPQWFIDEMKALTPQ